MSIFKRAWLYVTRKRGKTILLFAILLIMATFVLTGLSIWKASEAAQLDLRQSFGGKFDIFVDWSNSPYVVREELGEEYDEETGRTSSSFLMYSTVQFTPEDIAAIKSVPGVKYCSARLDDLIPFDGLSLFPGTIAIDAKYQGYTKMLGVCNTEDDELFTTGTLTLTDGRHISDGDTHAAIISQDLEERNELKIGDYLTAHCYSTEDQCFTGQEIKVQIIGQFTPNTVERFDETVTTYDKIQNRVFVDLQTSKEIDGGEINYGFSTLHITIDDPQDMVRVVADVKALPGIDWTAFTVEANNETYESAAAPLATLNELVDSLNRQEMDITPFKNILNDMYICDISKKVLAGRMTLSRQGKFCGGPVSLGLMRDPNDHGHLIVDPETAPAIRTIYDLASNGMGSMRIAKYLMEHKIPITRLKTREKPDVNYYSWGIARINSILRNPVYRGAHVVCKTHQKAIRSNTYNFIPRDKWEIIEDCHEAIVSREQWEQVQRIIDHRPPIMQGNNCPFYNLFHGLVYCATCGKSMQVRYENVGRTRKTRFTGKIREPIDKASYICQTYNRLGKNACASYKKHITSIALFCRTL